MKQRAERCSFLCGQFCKSEFCLFGASGKLCGASGRRFHVQTSSSCQSLRSWRALRSWRSLRSFPGLHLMRSFRALPAQIPSSAHSWSMGIGDLLPEAPDSLPEASDRQSSHFVKLTAEKCAACYLFFMNFSQQKTMRRSNLFLI